MPRKRKKGQRQFVAKYGDGKAKASTDLTEINPTTSFPTFMPGTQLSEEQLAMMRQLHAPSVEHPCLKHRDVEASLLKASPKTFSLPLSSSPRFVLHNSVASSSNPPLLSTNSHEVQDVSLILASNSLPLPLPRPCVVGAPVEHVLVLKEIPSSPRSSGEDFAPDSVFDALALKGSCPRADGIEAVALLLSSPAVLPEGLPPFEMKGIATTEVVPRHVVEPPSAGPICGVVAPPALPSYDSVCDSFAPMGKNQNQVKYLKRHGVEVALNPHAGKTGMHPHPTSAWFRTVATVEAFKTLHSTGARRVVSWFGSQRDEMLSRELARKSDDPLLVEVHRPIVTAKDLSRVVVPSYDPLFHYQGLLSVDWYCVEPTDIAALLSSNLLGGRVGGFIWVGHSFNGPCGTLHEEGAWARRADSLVCMPDAHGRGYGPHFVPDWIWTGCEAATPYGTLNWTEIRNFDEFRLVSFSLNVDVPIPFVEPRDPAEFLTLEAGRPIYLNHPIVSDKLPNWVRCRLPRYTPLIASRSLYEEMLSSTNFPSSVTGWSIANLIHHFNVMVLKDAPTVLMRARFPDLFSAYYATDLAYWASAKILKEKEQQELTWTHQMGPTVYAHNQRQLNFGKVVHAYPVPWKKIALGLSLACGIGMVRYAIPSLFSRSFSSIPCASLLDPNNPWHQIFIAPIYEELIKELPYGGFLAEIEFAKRMVEGFHPLAAVIPYAMHKFVQPLPFLKRVVGHGGFNFMVNVITGSIQAPVQYWQQFMMGIVSNPSLSPNLRALVPIEPGFLARMLCCYVPELVPSECVVPTATLLKKDSTWSTLLQYISCAVPAGSICSLLQTQPVQTPSRWEHFRATYHDAPWVERGVLPDPTMTSSPFPPLTGRVSRATAYCDVPVADPDLTVKGEWPSPFGRATLGHTYWVLPTNVAGYQPDNSDANLEAVVQTRVLVPPPLAPEQQEDNWAEWRTALAGLTFFEGQPIRREEFFDEWLAQQPGPKKKRYLAADQQLRDNGPDFLKLAMKRTKLMVKSDEILFRMVDRPSTNSKCYQMKPRCIANLSPVCQVRLGPSIFEAQRRVKQRWSVGMCPYIIPAASRSGEHRDSLSFYPVFGSGRTDLQLSEWLDWVLTRDDVGDTLDVLACGDDSLVRLRIKGIVFWYEADAAMFDQSESWGPLLMEYALLEQLGVSNDEIKMLLALAENEYVAYFRDSHCQIKIDRSKRAMRDTGGPDTSLGNTLITCLAWLLVVLNTTNVHILEHLQTQFLFLGFKMKIKSHASWESATFLKGMWYVTSSGPLRAFWGPLPSRILKVGKSWDDPRLLYPDLDLSAAGYAFLGDLAVGLSSYVCPAILPSFIARYRQCARGRPQPEIIRVESDQGPKPTLGLSARAQVIDRYASPEFFFETCETLISVSNAHCFLEHPLFHAMALVDYN